MYYRYVAYTQDRKIAKGVQAAASEDIASKILTSHGYKILSLKPAPAFLSDQERVLGFFNRVSPETIVTFSRQLALLHESGMDIMTSLNLLKGHISNRLLKKAVEAMISDLNKGIHLSEAMSRHPNVFSKIYVQSIKVGEQTGNLENVLREMADYLEGEIKASKSIRNAMKYPAIVFVVGIVVMIILVTFVLPTFVNLYKELNVKLPAITQALISFVGWFSNYGVYLLGAIFIIGLVLYYYTRTADGKMQRDKVAFKIPLLGRVAHLNELIRFCRNTAILYNAGMAVPEILTLVVETSNNLVIKDSLTRIQQGVLKGEGLSRPMSEDPNFFPMMVQMVNVGETTGSLDKTLTATADTYEVEAEDRMRNIIGLIQPAIIIVLGVMVAFIALALVSAMYSIYGQM